MARSKKSGPSGPKSEKRDFFTESFFVDVYLSKDLKKKYVEWSRQWQDGDYATFMRMISDAGLSLSIKQKDSLGNHCSASLTDQRQDSETFGLTITAFSPDSLMAFKVLMFKVDECLNWAFEREEDEKLPDIN